MNGPKVMRAEVAGLDLVAPPAGSEQFVRDHRTNQRHDDESTEEGRVGQPLQDAPPSLRSRAQAGISQHAGKEEQHGITGQNVVGRRLPMLEVKDDLNQPDHGETNAYERGRDADDVDREIAIDLGVPRGERAVARGRLADSPGGNAWAAGPVVPRGPMPGSPAGIWQRSWRPPAKAGRSPCPGFRPGAGARRRPGPATRPAVSSHPPVIPRPCRRCTA